ncbi:MAG: Gfo/Idh/MocA family oxidoreductase [Candidatus Bathyarchaeia archaeon]
MDKVKFAVIGVGGFGLKRINSILRSELADLAYIVDANKNLALELSKKLGVDYANFEDLISKKDYDVAVICVPNFLHCEFAVKLLEHRRTVWCEKPMAINVDLARKMVLKSIEKRVMLKVGSNPRHFPNVLKSEELIRQGYIGKTLFFRGWIGNEGLHLLNKSWYRNKETAGGGTLIDNGVHLIDLVRYLADEIVKCHSCRLNAFKHNLIDVEDNAVALYELSAGGFAFIHSSWTERSGYMYFEIHGSDGYVHVDSRWSKAIIKYGKSVDEPAYEDYTKHPKQSYDLELEDFVKDYRDGFHPKPTSYDGYRAVKIIMQSYSAAASQNPAVTFDSSDINLKEKFFHCFNVREK